MIVGCFQDEDDFSAPMQRVRALRPTVIEVKIPKGCVGVIIGRGGSCVKDIQDKTDTRITFKDEGKHCCRCREKDNIQFSSIHFVPVSNSSHQSICKHYKQLM
jgi:polyribonucleotide nucleotidyltransferase